MLVVKLFVFAPGTPIALRDTLGASYQMMQATGMTSGLEFYVGVAAGLIPGIVIVFGALAVRFSPRRESAWGKVIIAFAVISLIGTGGLYIGAVLAIVGGALALTMVQSIPKVSPGPANPEALPQAAPE